MKNNRTFLEKLLDGAEVEWKPLNKIVTTITAPVKLKREMYCSTGSTPIIDQGEKFIAGYTDENFEAIPSNEYIIFGDHSEHIKYVNFSFIQGADGLKILKPKEDNAKYIYYAFQNFYVKELNYKRHWSSAKETLIPLPPPTVQTEIVRILDALTALTSELTSELTLRQKQYQYYREKLLSFDGLEKSRGGVKKKLSDVAIYAKVRISADKLNKENYVGVENLLQNKLGKTSSNYVPTEGAFIEYLPNDILIGNIRPYLRKIWLADRTGGTNGDVLVIRLTDKNILPRYLYHILANEHFFEYNVKYSKGAKMPRGDKAAILQYEFDIPLLEEQQHIVSILDKFETLTNSITGGLPLAIKQSQKRYEYYRELLLNFS